MLNCPTSLSQEIFRGCRRLLLPGSETRICDATRLKEKSSWPVGHLVLTKKNLDPSLFYIGTSKPNLLLLIDCSQKPHATVIVLGASAYPTPLLVGCVPIAMQICHEAETLNYSEQLIVEHDRGDWFLHCGRYVTQQGGCTTCFLCKTGVLDFCPWHPENDPGHYQSSHQVLHLVGKIQPSGEINVMGRIDECPLQCQLIFFHVISDDCHQEIQHRICPLEVPFLLPTHGRCGVDLNGANCSKLLCPFQRRNLPAFLFQHFLIRAAGPMSILNTWLQPRSLI